MDKTNLSRNIVRELGWIKSQYRPGWYSCPFHSGDNTPSLHVDFENGIYYCFGCGKGGNLAEAFYEARQVSAYKYFDIENDDSEAHHKNDLELIVDEDELYQDPPEVLLEIGPNVIRASRSEAALTYLKNRGLPESVVKKYDLYYCENEKIVDNLNTYKKMKDRVTWFNYRLITPIKEAGQLVSLEGRDIYNNKDNLPKELYHKVLYPKGSSLKTIYNYDHLQKDKVLYLTEGLMDLMALQTCEGFENCTTIFGATVNERQIYMLNQFPKVVYIINNDEAGWTSLKNLGKGYKNELYFAVPPKDCDDIGDIINPKKLNSTIKAELEKGWLRRLVKYDEKLIKYATNKKV